MILEFKRPGNQMILDFDTDTSYLSADDAFESNQYLNDWPAARSPFMDRLGAKLAPGFTARLPVSDFLSVVASATAQKPNCVFDLRVTVGHVENSELQIAFEVLKVDTAGQVPLTADNAGFLVYALNWMAGNRPSFTLSMHGRSLFWIHVAGEA